jgi:hypothetical protein
MACVSCRLELCYSCYEPEETFDTIFDGEGGKRVQKVEPVLETEKRPVGRPRLPPEELKDALRAGRLRAGRTIKIEPGTICQWAGLKFAGGGIRPIIGCVGRPAGARHHGPNKSTADNEIGSNLHLICHQCHNRWHALNDEFYGERPADGADYLPRADAGTNNFHDPNSTATLAEQAEWQLYWQTPKAKRVLEMQVIVEEPEVPERDICEECLQAQDDPQYSYHEAWCSKALNETAS